VLLLLLFHNDDDDFNVADCDNGGLWRMMLPKYVNQKSLYQRKGSFSKAARVAVVQITSFHSPAAGKTPLCGRVLGSATHVLLLLLLLLLLPDKDDDDENDDDDVLAVLPLVGEERPRLVVLLRF
jgi:hypothetical protein